MPDTATLETPPPPVDRCLRALLFDQDAPSRRIDADALDAYRPVSDHRLLWLDAIVPDGDTDCAKQLGADPERMSPTGGGELGLAFDDDWTYLYVRALNWRDGSDPAPMPVVFAVGHNIVITLHHGPADFIDGVFGNEADQLRVGRLEAMSFATGLLDRMLTDYLDARDAFETRLDRLEIMILRRPRRSQLSDLQGLRHRASRLRRHLAVQRDLFDALSRPDFQPDQSESVEKHCRAVSVRYSRVMASIEAARELVNGSFNLYTSRTAEGTSELMETLTIVTVAMGLGATVANVLSMNFEVPLFNTGEKGFMVSTAIICGTVLVAGVWAAVRLLRGSR